MERNVPQPITFEQSSPLFLRSLNGRNLHHHHNAQARRKQIAVHVGKNVLVDDQTKVTRLQDIHILIGQFQIMYGSGYVAGLGPITPSFRRDILLNMVLNLGEWTFRNDLLTRP